LNNVITTFSWGIKKLKCTAVCWQLGILGRNLRVSVGSGRTELKSNFWYYGFCILADMKRHLTIDCCCCYEQNLLWCWTEEAESCSITREGIDGNSYCCMVLGIALCWCWQCLLTVGRNLLPHAVTPWDVTTWHNAADSLGTLYTLLNARKQHCKHHSDSGQQVASLPLIALEVITVCVLKIGFIKHNLLLWFLDMCTLQVCQLILSITLHKLKFFPVCATYNSGSWWMWFLFFTY